MNVTLLEPKYSCNIISKLILSTGFREKLNSGRLKLLSLAETRQMWELSQDQTWLFRETVTH